MYVPSIISSAHSSIYGRVACSTVCILKSKRKCGAYDGSSTLRQGLILLYSRFAYLSRCSVESSLRECPEASEGVLKVVRESYLTLYSLTFDVQYCYIAPSGS